MSNTKMAWQVGSTAFVKIFGVLALQFDPLTAFVLALIAMAAMKTLF